MKVSVIIPYHNEKSYIQDCLESLADQTFQDFEAIVVCDHCEEEAVEFLRGISVPFPIRILDMTDKTGVAAARNMGIRASQGEFLLFLDSDDYLIKEALEDMVERCPGQDVVYGRRRRTWYGRKVYYENGQKLDEQNSQPETDEGEEYEDRGMPEVRESDSEWIKVFCHMVRSNFTFSGLTALGILIRREFILEKDFFFDEDYKYFTDLPYVVRIMCATEKMIEIRKVLYLKRKHNDPIHLPSLSQISDEKTKLTEAMRAYVSIKEIVKGQEELAEIAIDGKFIKYYVRKIAPYYLTAEEQGAQEVYRQSLKCLPLISKNSGKRAMFYSRRLMKYSQSHGPEKIAKKVRRHSARQMFCSLITSKAACKKYLYRKVFSKMKIEENLVIFESFFGRNYSDSPKYIFEYLNKHYPGKYKCVWILNRKEKLPYSATRIKRFTLRYFYYMSKAKYFVFNGRQPKYFIKREGTVFLETWHGTPLKKLVFDMEDVTSASPLYKRDVYIQTRSWDYLVAPNQFCSDTFRRCFMYDGNMLETGYPRNDILHLEEKEKQELTAEIKKELGIPSGKKVILYAPTWRDDEFYGSGQYKFTLKLDLAKMQKELGEEYVVLLRTHYFIVDSLDLTAFEGFAYNASKYDDIARLYLVSDILITDYSSVFFDYANLKRPMLFFTYDLDKYRGVLRGFYINVEEELPGPMLFTTEEIIDNIRNLDKLEAEYKEKYDVFYEKYCGWEDGTSSQKVVETVFEK